MRTSDYLMNKHTKFPVPLSHVTFTWHIRMVIKR